MGWRFFLRLLNGLWAGRAEAGVGERTIGGEVDADFSAFHRAEHAVVQVDGSIGNAQIGGGGDHCRDVFDAGAGDRFDAALVAEVSHVKNDGAGVLLAGKGEVIAVLFQRGLYGGL